MSRPLTADPQRSREAAAFHRAVFSQWGHRCYKCGGKATDAAHIIPRSRLGTQRYAMATANGRPLCRACHDAQGRGEWDFDARVRRKALNALNRVLKQKIPA